MNVGYVVNVKIYWICRGFKVYTANNMETSCCTQTSQNHLYQRFQNDAKQTSHWDVIFQNVAHLDDIYRCSCLIPRFHDAISLQVIQSDVSRNGLTYHLAPLDDQCDTFEECSQPKSASSMVAIPGWLNLRFLFLYYFWCVTRIPSRVGSISWTNRLSMQTTYQPTKPPKRRTHQQIQAVDITHPSRDSKHVAFNGLHHAIRVKEIVGIHCIYKF